MVVVADASVAIRGDLSNFHRDLRGAEAPVQSLGQKLKGIFSPANIIGAAGVLGVAVGVRQLVSYAGDAAQAFSDLEQTGRTVDAVFGDSADTITEWGERAAEAAGLSKREVNEAAAVMGQTLLNMGFGAQEAADKVVLLQQRAADLALAFGKDPQDAILAITAAMRGERDTIEKFGVSIRQADVNSRILALGLDTSTAAAKKNSEAIAILDIILSQSASSAGRFADSQDDVAVKLAQNQARIDNMNAEIGRAVASIQLGAAKVGEFAGSELDKFATHFGDNMQTIDQLAQENGVTWDEMQQTIITAMEASGQSFEEVTEGMADDAKLARAAIAMEMPLAMQAMQDAIELGGPVVAAEMGKVAGMLPSEIRARIDEIRQAGEDTMGPDGLAGGILAAQQEPLNAIDELIHVMEVSLSAAEQIAELTGERSVTALTTGLNSPELVDRLAANDAYAKIIEQLNALGPAGRQAGIAFALALGMGIDEGANLPTTGTIAAARRLALGIRTPFPSSEPTDPKSALRGWTHLGADMVKQLTSSMDGELGTASATGRALAGALVPSVGMAHGISPMPTAMSTLPSSPTGGNTITVQMIDRVEKRTVEDIGYGLKRLDDLGKLPGSRPGTVHR